MRKYPSISEFPAIAATLLAWSAVTATESLNEPGITPGIPAQLVEGVTPEYPQDELRRQREGWVRLSYVVTIEGAVVDPIIEDSSGSREFEHSALSAVRKLLYEPATWNGDPVEQCFTSTMVTFSSGDADITMSGAFNRRYRAINRLLASHELEAANRQIDDTFRNFSLNVADLARLWMLRGTHAQAVGDDELQLVSFRKAVANGGKWIGDGVYHRLMTSIISLELSVGDYSSALSNYAALVGKNGDGAIPSSMQRAFERVRKQLDTAEILAVPARLTAGRQCDDCPADWQYETLRRNLSISKIRGSLDNIDIRCKSQRVVHEARADVTWTLPEEWGKCRIIVFGDKGTTFDLHEIEPALQDL